VLQIRDKTRSTDFLRYIFNFYLRNRGFHLIFPRVTEENPQFDETYVPYFSLRQNSHEHEYVDKRRGVWYLLSWNYLSIDMKLLRDLS